MGAGNSPDQQKSGLDLLHAIQNHQQLTAFQWSFILSSILTPLPFSWKLAIFNYLNTLKVHTTPVTIYAIISLLLIGIIALSIYILPGILRFFYYKNQKYVLLTVKPPHDVTKSTFSTTELFTVIHSLGRQISWLDAFLGKKKLISCELVSTKEEGIRYIVRVPVEYSEVLQKNLYAYLPGAEIEEINDYISEKHTNVQGKIKILDLKLSDHFLLPLQIHSVLSQHDPIAFITAHMTKLAADDLVAVQVILTPVINGIHRKHIKEIKRMDILIHNGFDITQQLNRHHKNFLRFIFNCIRFVAYLTIFIFLTPFSILASFISKGAWPFLPAYIFFQEKLKKNAELSKKQLDLQQMVREKMDDELFEVSIRLCLVGNKENELQTRASGFVSSLSVFQNKGLQGFEVNKNTPVLYRLPFFQKLSYFQYTNRLLSLKGTIILSVKEVSSFYHFPYTATTKTENLVNVKSNVLPAPLSLKQTKTNLDVVFAKNTYAKSQTMIGLTYEERKRHMYIVGATGTGKSTLMLSMISQDIQNGKGVCIIDPHGELAEAALSCIPDQRYNDIVYFDPDDLKYPIGLNLLELTPGLSEEDSLREKEFITESVVSLFRKVFSDSLASHPHRIEYILRNTIHTAFTLKNPTLFTLYDLLTDPVFQNRTIKNLTDERLQKFWKYEFGKAGNWQQVKMISPITAKIGRFLFSPTARRIIEQEQSTITVNNLMDEGKIIICNLSKGKLGEDTSEILGILILNKIQLAALQRARQETEVRKDFYLYVDEFQNFATPSFIQMLSEARKYKLSLILAEQTMSQIQDTNLINIILANTGTIVCFRTANPDDEKRILPQFSPYIERNEILNLPSFHFYMKISAMNPQEPFSGETIYFPVNKDREKMEKLIRISREKNARVYTNPMQVQQITNTSSNVASEESSTASGQNINEISQLP